VVLVLGCATVPKHKHPNFSFPENAFIQEPKREFEKLGLVRARVDYATLDVDYEEKALCKNYYNKAVKELLARSKKQGGDAVMDVRSVVFLQDGRYERYPTPECSDEGEEGQVLTEGIAIKWKPLPSTTPSPEPTPSITAKPKQGVIEVDLPNPKAFEKTKNRFDAGEPPDEAPPAPPKAAKPFVPRPGDSAFEPGE
jgi:hypothetical protein